MSEPHRNISGHVQPLASGRLVAPDETCEPDLNDPHDLALVESGALAPAETETDYAAMRVEQLAALAAGAELDVKPTGKDGPVKADYVKALTAHDKTQEA